MLTESFVVVLLVGVMAYICLRRGRQSMSMSILPLALSPLFNIFGYWASNTLNLS